MIYLSLVCVFHSQFDCPIELIIALKFHNHWTTFRVTKFIMVNICFLIVLGCCVLTQEVTKADMDALRLLKDTWPLSYTLKIQPIIHASSNSFVFDGTVTIRIRATASTTALTLNAEDLKINDVRITDLKTRSMINVTGYNLTDSNQILKIHLNGSGLTFGQKYDLRIDYSGTLRNDTTGFYRESYVDEDTNTTKYVLLLCIILLLKPFPNINHVQKYLTVAFYD